MTFLDLGEDAFDIGGPIVGSGTIVPTGEEFVDGSVPIRNTSERSPANRSSLEFCEPTRDEVKPA